MAQEEEIRFEHVSKSFASKKMNVNAVRNVSLEIQKGEIFGIIGFSGAGKSTLIRCMNLLIQVKPCLSTGLYKHFNPDHLYAAYRGANTILLQNISVRIYVNSA